MAIVKSLGESGLLKKGASETIENEVKKNMVDVLAYYQTYQKLVYQKNLLASKEATATSQG